MNIGFLNLALFAGMAALAIPPIIHFLNRRRHDVVDWGAMQFLLVSPAKRRRFMIEDIILMALRMGLIAILVLAFAAPYVSGLLVAGWSRPPRDTVLVLDGSYSMEQTDGTAPSPWQQARAWCDNWLKQAHAGDRVALLLAAKPPQPVVGELTADTALVREMLDQLSRPAGNADWPRSVSDAWNLLRDHGQAGRRDIIVIADRQKLGWADPATVTQWQALGRSWQTESTALTDDPRFAAPRVWAVTLGNDRAGPGMRLGPLQATRTLIGAGQRLRFTTALHWQNHDAPQVKSLRATVGESSIDVALPKRFDGKSGRAPITFDHRFAATGMHLVSVALEPADGADMLPADNRQDLAIEVVQELPVLLIDGDKQVSARSATFYLMKAFADPADKTKVSFIVPRVASHHDLDPDSMLAKAHAPPRVVVLADVPRLTAPQLAGLTRYVEDGGGLFIFLGPRADPAFYNAHLYRDGQGLLPARLERIEMAKSDRAVTLDVKRFLHPALELFREEPQCTLGHAGYTRWWKATAETHGRGVPVALFANDELWLIERAYGQGRVLLSTLPMDHTWDGHLPKTWEFPVLAHEIMFALADVRSGAFNLVPGQPLRIQPATRDPWATPVSIMLLKPDGKAATRTAAAWPFDWGAPGPPGVYQVQVASGPRWPVVVHADSRESDLTPATDEERRRVAESLPLRYLDPDLDQEQLPEDAGADQTQEVWWVFLIGVMALMCGELWLTRRMALARGRS
ncbi:MAG: BatA and WFA domain-containing protein [Gemmataceae bacterium]|nr:BatA and WFA domain-containing protein [Gemmataceae bacterium]